MYQLGGPFANRPLREFNEDPQGTELIEVVHPSQAETSQRELVATVQQAVSVLPKDQRNALKEYFGLDGGPPIQPTSGAENFLAALRDASNNPEGDALAAWLVQRPPTNQPEEVEEALRNLRLPQQLPLADISC